MESQKKKEHGLLLLLLLPLLVHSVRLDLNFPPPPRPPPRPRPPPPPPPRPLLNRRFDVFRAHSGEFRRGEIDGGEYYALFANDFALLGQHGLFHPIVDERYNAAVADGRYSAAVDRDGTGLGSHRSVA